MRVNLSEFTDRSEPTEQWDDRNESPAARAERLGVPLVGGGQGRDRAITEANPVVGVCGKCGLELRGKMHYACPQPGCPTGLGPLQL